MKQRIKVVLGIIVLLHFYAFGASDLNGFNHNIIKDDQTSYRDINDDTNLAKRPIEEMVDGSLTEKKIIYGDIETIGATVVVTDGNSKQGTGYNYEPTTLYDVANTSITSVHYVKEDPNYSKNSAYASFNFSDKKDKNGGALDNKIDGSKVIFARLYWGGSITDTWSSTNTPQTKYFDSIKDFHKIKFGYPNASGGMSYQTLSAKAKDLRWFGSFTKDSIRFQYQASYDVTDIVKKSLGNIAAKRKFSAGDIKGIEGAPPTIRGYTDGQWFGGLQSPRYAGWTLVIVYDFGPIDGENIAPRGINVYDGMKVLTPLVLPHGQSERIVPTELKFSDFYTPISGNFEASLTILSFGAAKEISAESILFRRGDEASYNTNKEVFANPLNKKGDQFNSTISKFGKHMNSNKKYNASMDLDVYDISDLMTHGQTEAYTQLSAKVIQKAHGVQGDEATVGMVAFATDLYAPNVCYEEKLLFKGANDTDDKFKEISTNSTKKTLVKSNSIMRVQLSIKNQTNERVEKLAIIAGLNPSTGTYKDNSTFIYKHHTGDSNFKLGSPVTDNSGAQSKLTSNGLRFLIGSGANNTSGGTLQPTDTAFIQYDMVIKDTFKENTYKAAFANTALNLEYKNGITIRKCKPKTYYLSVFDIAQFVVANEKFGKKSDSTNLFTQLADREFNVKIAYLLASLGSDHVPQGPSEELKVKVEVVETCDKNAPAVNKNQIPELTFNNSTGIHTIQNVLIEDAYPSLKFRLKYKDPVTQEEFSVCPSDIFAVRPKEYRVYDRTAKTDMTSASLLNLIGGRSYPNVGIAAYGSNNKITKKYNITLEPKKIGTSIDDKISLTPNNLPANCEARNQNRINEIRNETSQATFSQGIGTIEKQTGVGLIPFRYPDIGTALLTVEDSSFTVVDHASNDCIQNSTSNTPDSNGKIGCNFGSRYNFRFLPNDIHIDNMMVANFANNMTYMSGDLNTDGTLNENMYARLNFNIQARLGDTAATRAQLYTASCFANNVNFTLDLSNIPAGYTNLNDGTVAANVNQIKNEVIYFSATDNPALTKTDTAPAQKHNGTYTMSSNGFPDAVSSGGGTGNTAGIALGQTRINFGKNITIPKNPFTLSSSDLTFINTSDATGVIGSTYVAPTGSTITTADYYYGMVFAPQYSGPMGGFNAQVYFSLYCSIGVCNATTYPLATDTLPGGALVPGQTNWFVNTVHQNANNMGAVTRYTPNNPSTTRPVVVGQAVTNGIETIRLSTREPNTDTIRMTVSPWLLFNQTNPAATTNDFLVTFTSNVLWGGDSRDQAGNKAGVGSVVDGNGLGIIDNRTNKRLEW